MWVVFCFTFSQFYCSIVSAVCWSCTLYFVLHCDCLGLAVIKWFLTAFETLNLLTYLLTVSVDRSRRVWTSEVRFPSSRCQSTVHFRAVVTVEYGCKTSCWKSNPPISVVVADAASEPFARWLHQWYASVELMLSAGSMSFHRSRIRQPVLDHFYFRSSLLVCLFVLLSVMTTGDRMLFRYVGQEVPSFAYNMRSNATYAIWLDDVQCGGMERHIADCSHAPWGINNCAHSEDVAVDCYGQIARLNQSSVLHFTKQATSGYCTYTGCANEKQSLSKNSLSQLL